MWNEHEYDKSEYMRVGIENEDPVFELKYKVHQSRKSVPIYNSILCSNRIRLKTKLGI